MWEINYVELKYGLFYENLWLIANLVRQCRTSRAPQSAVTAGGCWPGLMPSLSASPPSQTRWAGALSGSHTRAALCTLERRKTVLKFFKDIGNEPRRKCSVPGCTMEYWPREKCLERVYRTMEREFESNAALQRTCLLNFPAQCLLHIKRYITSLPVNFKEYNESKTASPICINQIFSGLAQLKTQNIESSKKNAHYKSVSLTFI